MKYRTFTLGQIEAIFNKLGGENVARQILSGTVEVTVTLVSFLKPLTTVTLNPTSGKKTSDCFQGSRYYFRDADIDNLLPEDQKATKSGESTAHQLEKEMTFKEIAQSILNTKEEDEVTLQKMLIKAGHTHTLPEIEGLIERQESGEDVGLNTNSYANLFFTKNREGSVSVVNVYRSDRSWGVFVNSFGLANQWFRGGRVFFRN
ncbi:MAG: hypothetical protein MRY49_00570 [Candidatus Pacebacteria bacterium]|nr:hypothetical protein [Candidatus Paceibacterota bacterium]